MTIGGILLAIGTTAWCAWLVWELVQLVMFVKDKGPNRKPRGETSRLPQPSPDPDPIPSFIERQRQLLVEWDREFYQALADDGGKAHGPYLVVREQTALDRYIEMRTRYDTILSDSPDDAITIYGWRSPPRPPTPPKYPLDKARY